MGCDIHAGLEMKSPKDNWVNINPVAVNLMNPDKVITTTELDLGRDYDLFSLLEEDHNRNYNDLKDSIAPERGIPEDSVFYDYLTDDLDFWGQSYVTYQEIKDFAKKHPTIECSEYVSKEDYEALKSGKIKTPTASWQDGSADSTQYRATWQETSPIADLAKYLDTIIEPYDYQLFDIAWKGRDSYSKQELDKINDLRNNLADNVRLVFAFDN